jgi:hypothetical protein
MFQFLQIDKTQQFKELLIIHIMYLISLLLLCISKINLFVRNINSPTCVNCLHYIKDTTFKGSKSVSSDIYGKCKLFGTKDLVTGSITYDYASTSRINGIGKCDENGKYFEENVKIDS